MPIFGFDIIQSVGLQSIQLFLGYVDGFFFKICLAAFSIQFLKLTDALYSV